MQELKFPAAEELKRVFDPVALSGSLELDEVVLAAPEPVRPAAETQFLERLKAGEAAAFERFVSERTSDVYGLLYRLTDDPEEARDLTQETFLRAFQSIGRFRGDADLKTWLYRIALNLSRNRWRWWRRKRRDVTVSLDTPLGLSEEPLSATLRGDAPDPEQTVLGREREAALSAALRSLGSPYREAVVLRDVEGLSYEQVAAALDANVGTVKSRIARGREELRKKLGYLNY
jgi:RNA polymerase sigma-70 factor (ECF subfamily)